MYPEFYRGKLQTIISSNILDYDIARAHYSVLSKYNPLLIKNLNPYNKKDTNIKLGKILNLPENKKFYDICVSTENYAINEFIEFYKIVDQNIISISRDGLLFVSNNEELNNSNEIVLKKFPYLSFKNKNKFTSYYKIHNNYFIFIDSKNNNIIIKGINDEVVESSKFVQHVLLPFLISVENLISSDKMENYLKLNQILGTIKTYKLLYFNNSLYHPALSRENSIVVDIKNKEKEPLRVFNYCEFLLPLFRKIIKYVI